MLNTVISQTRIGSRTRRGETFLPTACFFALVGGDRHFPSFKPIYCHTCLQALLAGSPSTRCDLNQARSPHLSHTAESGSTSELPIGEAVERSLSEQHVMYGRLEAKEQDGAERAPDRLEHQRGTSPGKPSDEQSDHRSACKDQPSLPLPGLLPYARRICTAMITHANAT